jgi:hypothetical protein
MSQMTSGPDPTSSPTAAGQPRWDDERAARWLTVADERERQLTICAAAQAKVKDEIQAIPEPNHPAVIEARGRIMRETITELRALGSPKAVRWPYSGRAFPLLQKFYGYPHNVQPPESLARQIQQIPGLDKCIFPA